QAPTASMRYTPSLHDALPISPLGGHHGGSADTCSATGHLPLDEQDSVLPTLRTKNATQYRGGQMKWKISYQHVWNMRKSIVQERSEEHTSELQSRFDLVCRLL